MNDSQAAKRIPEIELMKAIAIIGMVFVHVLEGSLSVFENAWTFPGNIPYTLIEFIGGIPAAGVFTFAMGWGAAFSDRSTPKRYLHRALTLGILIFYVNFVYAIFPGIIDPADFGSFSEHPWAIIGFNIYSLATLCMLFFALMKCLQDKPVVRYVICGVIIAVILVTVALVAPESYNSGNPWIDTLIGIFIRENHYSWFALVPWGIFPVMGYLAGILYRRINNRNTYILYAAIFGASLVTVSQAVIAATGAPNASMNPGWVEEVDYYTLSLWNVLCAAGIVALEYVICAGIMTLTQDRLHPVLSNMSKNVMEMFLVHWIFISPLYPQLLKVTNVWINALIGLGILILTYVLVSFMSRVKSSDEHL